MNFFSTSSAAGRCAAGRPYFHPLIINLIKELISFPNVLAMSLDVGCGTGLSTVALAEISKNVVGIDASLEMIKFAPKIRAIGYVVSMAE